MPLYILSNGEVRNGCICNFLNITTLFFKFKYKFSLKCPLTFSRLVFIKNSNTFLGKQELFGAFLFILKEIGKRRKFFREIFLENYKLTNYLRLCDVLVHHKCNGARLLSLEAECTSCLMVYRSILEIVEENLKAQ